MGYVLLSIGLSLAHIASSRSCYARITSAFNSTLLSKVVAKYDKVS